MGAHHLVAIDLDGTLEDSRADMVAAAQRVRRALGLPAREAALIRPWVSRGMDNLYRNVFDDYIGGKGESVAEVRERYEADYLAHVAVETKLYPGIADALPALARQAPVVVVTNKPEHISRALLDALGVEPHVHDVVGGDTCAEAKPSKVMLEEAARRAGVEPEASRAIMIGDSNGDITLGRAYGATTIWCAWGYAERTELAPDRTARTPEELPELVGEIFQTNEG